MVDRPLHSLSDDELLSMLGAAMASEQLEPSPDTLDQARLLLAERRRGWRHRLAGRLADWRWRLSTGWRARLAVAGATVGVVVVAGGTAFALGAPLPSPVRSLAYDIGLPVTAPAVVQVQNAAHAVQSDLASTAATSPATTVRDTRTLAHALLGLSPGQRLTVRWSERVFAQACHDIASYAGASSAQPAHGGPASWCAQSSFASPMPAGQSGSGGAVPGGARGTSPEGRNTTPGSPSPTSHGSGQPGSEGRSGVGGEGPGGGGEGPGGGGGGGGSRQGMRR